MKKNVLNLRQILAFAFMAISITAFAQPNRNDNSNGRLKESSLPDEWRVPSGGSFSIKTNLSLVTEANSESFKTLLSFGGGEPNEPKTQEELPAGMDSKQYKFIVLFKTDATWAAPLKDNELAVSDNSAMKTVMAKYHLVLDKWYDADNGLEGLVVKVDESGVNVIDAARELSKVTGVEIVHLKSPK